MESTSNEILPDIMGDETYSEDGEVFKKKMKKKRNLPRKAESVLPEKCAVCGNQAIGYHYDVATCNGCKAFFRRTIITGRRVECRKGNKCLEKKDPTSRRVCPGCRIAKCEKVGMNPMNIRAEITENGEILKAQFMANQDANYSLLRAPAVIEDELSSAISHLTLIESQTDVLFNSSMPERYGDLRSLSDILQMNPILEILKIPNLTLLRNEIFPVQAGFVHNTCLAIVEYTKMFGSFSQVSPYSVEKLIRHGLLMCGGFMSARRSIRKFNSDSLRHTDGSLCGKPTRSWNGIWVDHKKMIHKTIHSFIQHKLDDAEFLFLKAILICNPAVNDILEEDVKIVERERFKYGRFLLNYCLKKDGNIHGPDRFNTLLSMISLMEIQQKNQKCFHLILRSYYHDADFLVSPLYDDIMASD